MVLSPKNHCWAFTNKSKLLKNTLLSTDFLIIEKEKEMINAQSKALFGKWERKQMRITQGEGNMRAKETTFLFIVSGRDRFGFPFVITLSR